jgi:predicted phage baseplate assembly protein
MPLNDAAPVIDDRSWQQLVDEIRSRIPHYTPEWTDFNDSDPGITLAQVFAHLGELLLYRMARVPELAYVKFLELIGVELIPALPARAEVGVGLADGHPEASVLLPAGTRFAAAGDDGVPLVFESERALTAVALRLLALQSDDGAQYRDLGAANAAAGSATAAPDGFEPFGALPRDGGALVLGLGFPDPYPTPDAFPPLAIDIACWTAQDPATPRRRGCSGAAARAYASARVVWEGFDGAGWLQLDTLSDETLALTRSGHIVVRVPAHAAPALRRGFVGDYAPLDPDSGEPQPPLFWLRARLADVQYSAAPRLAAVRLNTVPVLQAETLHDEVLGGSSGERHQRLAFGTRPVLKSEDRLPWIEIDEGQGPQRWTVVPDLLGSGPRDRHVVVHWAAGELEFGDGENGAVPVANAANPDANVVAREYRSGGGARGNVGAGAIAVLVTPIAGVDAAAVGNLFAAAGGDDEETLDAAKKRARRSLRARDRAVTPQDFELLALQAGQVARARALPLVHPLYPGVEVPGAITVIVVPARGSAALPALGTPPPMPSDGLLRTVCEYLDARRLIGTELQVVAPVYAPIEVHAQVVALDDADTRRVKEEVEAALATWFDPLLGGDDGAGWPFGGAIRWSKAVQRAFRVAGVDAVPALRIVLDGQAQPACADVPIAGFAPHALPLLEVLQVEVATQREWEAA